MIPISQIKRENGISMALVILCSRIYFKTAEIDDLKDFINTNDIYWSDFFKICRKHRIRPLTYRIILKTNLPEEVKKRISNELNNLTLQSFDQAKETERIIFLLKENKIKILPYKGTAFSKQFFGNISMRESSDIDLIIHPEDLTKTIKILEEDGFQSHQKEYYYSLGHKNFIKSHKDFNFDKFIGEKRQFHVELHFNIIGKNIYLLKKQNQFKSNLSEKDFLFKEQIFILNPFEHFRAISLHHMLQDGMGYLKTVIDITQALIKIETNKDLLDSEISEREILNELYSNYNIDIIKSLISNLIGIEFKINSQKINNNLLINRILSSSYKKNRDNNLPILNAIKHHYLYTKNTKHYYKKTKHKNLFLIKNILGTLTPQSDDFIAIKLSRKLYFLYYFLRPFRLIFFPGDPNNK